MQWQTRDKGNGFRQERQRRKHKAKAASQADQLRKCVRQRTAAEAPHKASVLVTWPAAGDGLAERREEFKESVPAALDEANGHLRRSPADDESLAGLFGRVVPSESQWKAVKMQRQCLRRGAVRSTDCHSAAPPSTLVSVSIAMERESVSKMTVSPMATRACGVQAAMNDTV